MEACRQVHAHGEGFEEREFACGCYLKWSPNFSKLEVHKQCPKHPEVIEAKQKVEKLKGKLEELLTKMNLTEEKKDQIRRYGWYYL